MTWMGCNVMSEMEDLINRIKQLPNPTLLVFVFPSWQVAGDALMELSFAKTELGSNASTQRILWKVFVINETGEANLVMGGNMSAKERDEAIEQFRQLGQTRVTIYPKSEILEEIKKKAQGPE